MTATSSPPAGTVRHYSRVCPGLWVDVPDQGKPGTSTQRATIKNWRAACRAAPGEWRRYPADLSPSSIRTLAPQINGGRLTAWQPAGAWQAEIRTDDAGAESVWVRYRDGAP